MKDTRKTEKTVEMNENAKDLFESYYNQDESAEEDNSVMAGYGVYAQSSCC